jgi:hypothetical protein
MHSPGFLARLNGIAGWLVAAERLCIVAAAERITTADAALWASVKLRAHGQGGVRAA